MAALTASPTVTATQPQVRIRPLGPPDVGLLDEVFDGLSSQSRYTRFHGPKPRMSPSEREYLSATDGVDHLAVVALDADGHALGIARSVRLRDDPGAAEVAAEVVDDWQRQGLGSELMRGVARRATAVGIGRLQANVLAQTGFARSLRRRGWRATATDGLTVTLEIDAWALARARATPCAPQLDARVRL